MSSKTEYYCKGFQHLRISIDLGVGVNTDLLIIERVGIEYSVIAKEEGFSVSDSVTFYNALKEVKTKLKVK